MSKVQEPLLGPAPESKMKKKTGINNHFFTCSQCGSHDIVVREEGIRSEYYHEILPCLCGAEDMAAEKEYRIITPYSEEGLLDELHHWEFDKEKYEEDEEEIEDISFKVCCQKCFEKANDDDWEIEEKIIEEEDGEDSSEIYVICATCQKEIEFGWSHPGQGGRIWPAECADFNPGLTWPEPRYRNEWAKKGWLNPHAGTGKKR